MSISDVIVVMKLGVVQQIGKPQDVYDNPCNLFVSKFLGTPAINVFDGKVKNNYLYIGDDKIMEFKSNDRDVYVGIRPEGLVVSDIGTLTCDFIRRDVMGRDHSVISYNEHCVSDKDVRAIIPSDTVVDESSKTVKFDIKPSKIYVFDKESEERLDV